MRSVILLAVSVFLVIVLGGIGISWTMQARHTRIMVEDTIKSLNSEAPYITYADITTSGFPWNVNVSIVNPRFNGDMRAFLTGLTRRGLELGDLSEMTGWTEDLRLDGAITLGINALSDKYTLTFSGTWNNISNLEKGNAGMTAKGTGDMSCAVHLERGQNIFSTLWDFYALAKTERDLSQDLRLLDCNIPSYQLVDSSTNELLASLENMRFYVSHNVVNKERNLRVYLKTVDSIVTPLGDRTLGLYLLTFDPKRPLLSNYAGYGKQNAEVDFSFAGPVDFDPAKTDNVRLSLDKFELSNDLVTHSANVSFHNKLVGDARDSKITFRSESKPKENYDLLIQRNVRDYIHQIYNSTDVRVKQLRDRMHIYEEDGIIGIASPAIPRLSPLGTLVFGLSATYQGNAAYTNGTFLLRDFELGATPYAITAKADLTLASSKLVPQINAEVNCRNCYEMVDDAANYLMRVHKVMTFFDPRTAISIYFERAQVAGLKEFLGELATNSEQLRRSGNFTYIIIGDGTLNVTVNGKGLDEVSNLFTRFVPPATPAAAPNPSTLAPRAAPKP